MLEIKGKKNNIAKIFTDNVDEATISQIYGIVNSPLVDGSKIRIMPDCHAGAGCVIGTTITINDKVCPNIVGVDIGCGMLCAKLNVKAEDVTEDFLKSLDDVCRNKIVSGMAVNSDLKNWKGFKRNTEPQKWLNQFKCIDKLINQGRLALSLGSLGGGNHFIELNKDGEGNVYLVIHSGSRNLGKQVAELYQDLAIESTKAHNKSLCENLIATMKKNGEKDIDAKLSKLKEDLVFPSQLAYLVGEDLNNYLFDMSLCQEFATENRKAIMNNILVNLTSLLGYKIDAEEVFTTIHNYINVETKMLRKGAISAEKGEIVLIPINMRDGSLICEGLGNEDWNCSAPHGAGRILSRSQAKQMISVEDFKETMKDVYSSSVSESTLDESPFAYKNMEEIINCIDGKTVNVIKRIIPIYNFKA